MFILYSAPTLIFILLTNPMMDRGDLMHAIHKLNTLIVPSPASHDMDPSLLESESGYQE